MLYVPTLGIYVNKVEDLRDKVSEDIYDAIECLVEEGNDEIHEKYEILKDEFEVYESELENLRSAYNEIKDLVDKFEEELDNLYEYVEDTKRMNRDKILNSIKKVEIELINNIINKL